MRKRKIKNIRLMINSIIIHLIIYALAFITILPFIWMVLTSVKDISEIFIYPPKWFPTKLKLSNYIDAFNAAPFGRYYLNSLIVATTVTFGQLITCSLAAYAFARLKFPGRDILFYMFLGTMMIPMNVTMIPAYMILSWLGWIDTLNALIVPGLASAFGTFLLRQFFMTIPKDLEESAYIDGASRLKILLRIII